MSYLHHTTNLGEFYSGNSVATLKGFRDRLKNSVQLIFTSPPFPLNNKKSYGNLKGEEYREWFVELATTFSDLLTENGSIVIELGNAWIPGRPVQSLLHLESLIGFVNHPDAGLRLCQQFICYNPSRLPSPAEWVTVKRIRLTDSYTNIWWMAKTDFPKADNRRILRPYSTSMKKLLKRQTYNNGKRPSEHVISENGFLVDHGGSIAQNFFELEAIDEERHVRLPNAFSISNSSSNDYYTKMCRLQGIEPHPARMPLGLASLFIQFLTDPGDLVLDPFAGSNTTGYAAEKLGRHWISIDIAEKYAQHAQIRLADPSLTVDSD